MTCTLAIININKLVIPLTESHAMGSIQNPLELIGVDRLKQLQRRFFEATGFPNGCFDADGNLLAYEGQTEPLCMELIRGNPTGLKRCENFLHECQQRDSDQDSKVLRCHAGLLDGRIPIQIDDTIIGYLVMGQILDSPPDRDQAFNYAEELGIEPEAYWNELQKVKIVPLEKIQSAALLLEFMGSEIAVMASANLQLQKEIKARKDAEDKLIKSNAELSAANRTLEQSEEKFRLLVDNALDAFFLADPTGKFLMVNQQACRSTGYSKDELLSMSTEEIEIGHTEEEIAAIFTDLSQGKPHRRLGMHRHKDGSTFPVDVVLCSYTVGEKMFMLAVARDISEQKQAEEERELLISDLQNAITEIKQLSGLLPICSSCKKIRDDSGYWNKLETYIQAHSGAEFSHGICPDCVSELYGQQDWFKAQGKKEK